MLEKIKESFHVFVRAKNEYMNLSIGGQESKPGGNELDETTLTEIINGPDVSSPGASFSVYNGESDKWRMLAKGGNPT